MTTTASRLNTALNIRNMKATDLHRATGINKSSISQYLAGVVCPKQDRIYLLAKALNVNELWLMGHDVPMERTAMSSSSGELPKGFFRLSDQQRKIVKVMQGMSEEGQDSVLLYANNMTFYLVEGETEAEALRKNSPDQKFIVVQGNTKKIQAILEKLARMSTEQIEKVRTFTDFLMNTEHEPNHIK